MVQSLAIGVSEIPLSDSNPGKYFLSCTIEVKDVISDIE